MKHQKNNPFKFEGVLFRKKLQPAVIFYSKEKGVRSFNTPP